MTRDDSYSRNTHDTRDLLRALPALVGTPPGFDPATAAANPVDQYLDWLRGAIEAGVPEPHAMTVSTVDEDGVPDARVLILKDITDKGQWCIAGSALSAKGRQLQMRPVMALTSYWGPLLRSVRVRGQVSVAPRDEAARDFAARSESSRAIALSAVQSSESPSLEHIAAGVADTTQRLRNSSDFDSEHWTVWQLMPSSVEFWEGAESRLHTRLRYERDTATNGWRRILLHP